MSPAYLLNGFFSFYQIVMTIVVAFILELFLFRIQYRRKMHLEDIDGKYIMTISFMADKKLLKKTINPTLPQINGITDHVVVRG